MFRRIVPYLAIILMLSLVIACTDDEQDAVEGAGGEPQSQQFRASQEQGSVRAEQVEILNDGTSPRQLNITAGAPAQIEVKNSTGAACSFFIGELMTGLQVPPGQTVRQSMTVPVGTNTQTVKMGCEGDTKRQGDAVIEFKGVRPGEGR